MRESVRAMTRLAVLVHRYLGIALALVFAMWFASGVVLYYVPFPKLTTAERFASLDPVPLNKVAVGLDAALAALGEREAQRVRLGTLGDRPVYRVLPGRSEARWRVVFADSGEVLREVDDRLAAGVAARFGGQPSARVIERMELDQWTVSLNLAPFRPLAEVALDDAAGTRLYVSLASAEVVRDTTRIERFWNWVGAIPHWIYPVQLRRNASLWHEVVVWLSVPGVLLALTGVYLGIARLRLRAPAGRRRIPYREAWARWHHILGLAACVLTLTWIFSGLMSVNPWKLFSAPASAAELAGAVAGGPLDARSGAAPALLRTLGTGGVREIEWRRLGGVTALELRTAADRSELLVPGESRMRPGFQDGEIERAVRAARPEVPLLAFDLLHAYDDHYYTREPAAKERRLPVARAKFADGQWLYVDAQGGQVVSSLTGAQRVRRWIYNGLHSLDFAVLMAYPRLRDAVVIGFSLLGFAASVAGAVLGWRRLMHDLGWRRRRTPHLHLADGAR